MALTTHILYARLLSAIIFSIIIPCNATIEGWASENFTYVGSSCNNYESHLQKAGQDFEALTDSAIEYSSYDSKTARDNPQTKLQQATAKVYRAVTEEPTSIKLRVLDFAPSTTDIRRREATASSHNPPNALPDYARTKVVEAWYGKRVNATLQPTIYQVYSTIQTVKSVLWSVPSGNATDTVVRPGGVGSGMPSSKLGQPPITLSTVAPHKKSKTPQHTSEYSSSKSSHRDKPGHASVSHSSVHYSNKTSKASHSNVHHWNKTTKASHTTHTPHPISNKTTSSLKGPVPLVAIESLSGIILTATFTPTTYSKYKRLKSTITVQTVVNGHHTSIPIGPGGLGWIIPDGSPSLPDPTLPPYPPRGGGGEKGGDGGGGGGGGGNPTEQPSQHSSHRSSDKSSHSHHSSHKSTHSHRSSHKPTHSHHSSHKSTHSHHSSHNSTHSSHRLSDKSSHSPHSSTKKSLSGKSCTRTATVSDCKVTCPSPTASQKSVDSKDCKTQCGTHKGCDIPRTTSKKSTHPDKTRPHPTPTANLITQITSEPLSSPTLSGSSQLSRQSSYVCVVFLYFISELFF